MEKVNKRDMRLGLWVVINPDENYKVVKISQITEKKMGYHLKPNESVMHYCRWHQVFHLDLDCFFWHANPELINTIGFQDISILTKFLSQKRLFQGKKPNDIKKEDLESLYNLNISERFAIVKILTFCDYVDEFQMALMEILSFRGIEKEIKPPKR